MIIETLVVTGVLAASSAIGGFLASRRRARRRRAELEKQATEASTADPAAAARARGLRVDDVLLYADEELWLAGALELDEEGFVARLFRTPGAKRCDWLVQLDADAERVALLRNTTDVPTGTVPERLRVDGMVLSLVKRGRACVRSEGAQLPTVPDAVRYAILAASGGRTLVVLDFEGAPRIAVSGELVPREMLDLLAGS